MQLGTLAKLFRTPHAWGRMQIARDLKPFIRLHFLYAALKAGLLDALKTPRSLKELVHELDVTRPDLLEVLLEMGVQLRELSKRDGVYSVRGRRTRAMVGKDHDPLVALIEEYVTMHGSAYQHLDARLTGAPLGNYLEDTGELIARSSRIMEPVIGTFVESIVETGEPMRLLEVGCGSGIYLRYAAEKNAQLTGVGIDLQDEVVAEASANLAAWGISERFDIIEADIRHPPPDLSGAFDLITLYNNIYYFTLDERPGLFTTLRSWLAPDGRLALVSLMQGDSVTTTGLDLLLRSTSGCAPLPKVDELTEQLHESGFTHIETSKLIPLEPLYSVVARQ